MSRTSSKSGLSPSISRSTSNGIDLGKGNSVDRGGASAPSVTSGGIGVTREVANIGGVSVSGGVSVEISPVDIGIGYDSTENSVSIAAGAEIPGGLLGASGGVTIDLDTGEITGGSVGVEGLGIGVNISGSKDGSLGVGITLQIPFTPIEIELGLGFPPKKPTTSEEPYTTPPFSPEIEDLLEPKKPNSTPKLPPDPFPPPPPPPPAPPIFENNNICKMVVTFYRGTRSNYWTIFPTTYRIAESANYSKGIAEVSYKEDGTLEGAFTTWYDSYYWEISNYRPPVNKENISHPPLRPVPKVDSGWTVGKNFSRRQLSDNVFEYWGLEYHIYATLKSEIKAGYPATFEPALDVWWFWSQGGPTYNIYSIEAHWCYKEPEPPPFPNPPPRRRNKMDECCRENLKFLRVIYTGLGIAKFPGKLPATIIQEVPKEGEKPSEPPQVPIEDFVDLLDWQFRRDDERWGQWVIQIDVKDADLTKEGNQSKQIKFPNLAESIAELEGQMLSVMANVDALIALTTKNLVESGMARQESIKSYLAAKTIIKYMAFKSTEIDVTGPMTFTPGAETISDLIKESEGHIKGTDYVEKETLRDIYLDLLQAAAIIRAVHWQKIDSKSDTKAQLLNLLKGTVDLAGLITNPKKESNGEENKFDPAQNFEDFIDSVEDGFRNTTGISDIENPYGRTPDRRPRIRQIGDNISQAGGDD